MKKPFVFVISTFLSLLYMNLSGADLTAVATYSPPMLPDSTTTATDFAEIIKLLVSTAGGIITTILLAWLRTRYPDLFAPKIPGSEKETIPDEKLK